MKNYIQPGEHITLPAPSAVVSGQLLAVGALVGVVQTTVASGVPVVLVRRGVFSLPKATGQAWTAGAKVYLVAADGNLTTTATGNTLVGVAVEPAANGDTVGAVLLDGVIR